LVSVAAKASLNAGQEFAAQAEAADADGDSLSWHWSVVPETAGRDDKGHERVPKALGDCLIAADSAQARLRAPVKPGPYRVFLLVKDGRGRAATANFPFEVK
jgi:hypothetical protein